MAWTTPRTWSASEIVTATLLNTHVRDNLNATAPGVVSTKGDMVAATGANAITRVPISGSNGGILTQNSACNAGVSFDAAFKISASVPTITAACYARLVVNTNSSGNKRGSFIFQSVGACQYEMGVDANANNIKNFFLYDTINAAYRFVVTASGQVLIGTSSSETTSAASGMLYVSGANSACHLFAISSSTVAHGYTSVADTATIFTVRRPAATGGAILSGLGTGNTPIEIRGYGGAADTTRSQAGVGIVQAFAIDGSGSAATTANVNAFVIRVNASSGGINTRFIFDSDGDLHADAAVTASAFDGYDDAHMIRALEIERNPAGIVRTEFDGWLKHNRGDLERAKIATFNDGPGGDGSVFVNYTGLARLQSGAIWQLYTELQNVKRELFSLTGRPGDMPPMLGTG